MAVKKNQYGKYQISNKKGENQENVLVLVLDFVKQEFKYTVLAYTWSLSLEDHK